MFECPSSFVVSRDTLAAMQKYNDLTREASYEPGSSPLHFYSLYGATTLEQWDAIVRAHVARLGYKRGERIFEAGTAAGAFVDSLARQYGVLVGGVDVAQDAIAIAQSRINGTFCAANSDHIPFVESASFDHAVSFAVLMYVDGVSAACKVASELVRIVKPGGTVFLGQINDPDMRVFASGRAEGMWGVSMLFWHRFAYLGGHEVVVIKYVSAKDALLPPSLPPSLLLMHCGSIHTCPCRLTVPGSFRFAEQKTSTQRGCSRYSTTMTCTPLSGK
jgi:2-polyprenyl-3-methyl-5-hydroxy-6-metoxy-1,4-benzoquinol methylase